MGIAAKLAKSTAGLVSALIGHSLLAQPAPPPRQPVCSPGAICFSGEVSAGQEYRHSVNATLDFVLKPGWTIAIEPTQPEEHCNEFASVVNAPYRAHRDLYIDTSYGWTAEEEAKVTPRQFSFVTNCADQRVEGERLDKVLWPYNWADKDYKEAAARLGSSPLGHGLLWIVDSRITHAEDTPERKLGKIEWMRFAVEIKLPKR